MSYAYNGKFIRLDLTKKQWEVKAIAEEQVENYLLGSGLAAKIFWDEMDENLDPLDPDSPLLFVNGLLTGTFLPTACKVAICGRSPLTGIWSESIAGGYWAAEFKFTSYDGLIITGRSSEPVYLWINDDKVEIRPADFLQGLDCYQIEERLREETDPKARVASIGIAGDNLSRIAAVVFDGRHARVAGRGGMGAVMGSKKLKAIVVRGTNKPEVYDVNSLRANVKENIPLIKKALVGLSSLGTAGGIPATEVFGDLPIKNWLLGNWEEGAEKTSGQTIVDTIFTRHYGCYACPIRCGKEVKVDSGPFAGVDGHGPEYETVAGFGALCLNDNLESIVRANDLCNRYGLDTISTSAVIAFAMEAYERRLMTTEDTGGIELRWGDGKAIVRMIEKIAKREDVGDLLAEGVKVASEKIGGGSVEFAIHTKGLEVPFHDPRAFVSMAVNYATANRGACHLEALTYWHGYGTPFPDLGYIEPPDIHSSDEDKAKLVHDFQNYFGVFNALGLCKFAGRGGVGPRLIAEWLNLALGWDWGPQDVLRMGEKLFNLKRMINVRYGITRKDDTLPNRLLTHDRRTGGAAGILPDLDKMLPAYYEIRGWDELGVPTAAKLEALGLLGDLKNKGGRKRVG